MESPKQFRVMTTCEDCGQEFERVMFGGAALRRYCADCTNARAASFEADQARRRAASIAYRQDEYRRDFQRGIPIRFQGKIWDDFKFDRGGEANRSVVEFLKGYCQRFPVEGYPSGCESVILASKMNGVGKTMLACLMLDAIIGRYEGTGREHSPFQLWSAGDIRMRLRSAERFGGKETPETVFAELNSVPLLIIDDVGKEQTEGRDAGLNYEMYFQIIDTRYRRQLPLVLTTNLGPEPWPGENISLVDLMGRASVSRLVEMTGGNFFEIDGEDRR